MQWECRAHQVGVVEEELCVVHGVVEVRWQGVDAVLHPAVAHEGTHNTQSTTTVSAYNNIFATKEIKYIACRKKKQLREIIPSRNSKKFWFDFLLAYIYKKKICVLFDAESKSEIHIIRGVSELRIRIRIRGYPHEFWHPHPHPHPQYFMRMSCGYRK